MLRGMGTAGVGAFVRREIAFGAPNSRSAWRLQRRHVTGRNSAPTSVSGALVGDSGRFLRSWDSFAFSSFLFLVSEDSHSLMGGSDVVNCGRYWALWAHRIAVRISNMLLSVLGLFIVGRTDEQTVSFTLLWQHITFHHVWACQGAL